MAEALNYVIERISKDNQSSYWTGKSWTEDKSLAQRYADVPSTWRILRILSPAANHGYHICLLQVS